MYYFELAVFYSSPTTLANYSFKNTCQTYKLLRINEESLLISVINRRSKFHSLKLIIVIYSVPFHKQTYSSVSVLNGLKKVINIALTFPDLDVLICHWPICRICKLSLNRPSGYGFKLPR